MASGLETEPTVGELLDAGVEPLVGGRDDRTEVLAGADHVRHTDGQAERAAACEARVGQQAAKAASTGREDAAAWGDSSRRARSNPATCGSGPRTVRIVRRLSACSRAVY